MCLNAFIDIIIEFHHHFLIITFLPCQHAIPLRSFIFIPVDPFQLSYNLSLLFTSIHHLTFHIPHSMSSLVVLSIVESKLYIYKIILNTLIFLIHESKVLIFQLNMYKLFVLYTNRKLYITKCI